MANLRYNNQQGTLAAPLSPTDTTILFAEIPDFATLNPPDLVIISIDPGLPTFEVVALRTYSAGSNTGAIVRAALDGAHWPASAHAAGATWECAPLITDFTASAVGADASGSAAAAQAAAVASSLQINGGTMLGPIVLPGNPTSALQAAPKQYVDSVATGLAVKATCVCATTTTLPTNTYNNGTAGVGATLTASSNGILTIDGHAVLLNDSILVKNESSGVNNGIYLCTTAGDAGTPYVLTRRTDNDQSTEFEGAYTFVTAGTVNAGSGYICGNTFPPTIGTTPITWTQFTGGTTYTADGTTVTLTGTQFSVTPNVFLPEAGGTMSGAIAMGSHKITGLTNGSSAQDAAAFGQLPTALPPSGTAGGDLGSSYPNPTVTATHLASALPVTQGGTGAATLTGLVKGNGTGAMTAATAGTDFVGPTTGTQIQKASAGGLTAATPGTDFVTPTGSGAGLTGLTVGQVSGAQAGPLTGDVTTSGAAATLKNTGPGASTAGTATQVSSTTIDAKGRVTGLTNTSIQIAESQVTNLTTDLAAKAPLASPALTGTPTAPTNTTATDTSTQIATDAFVQNAIMAALVATGIWIPFAGGGSAPSNALGLDGDLAFDYNTSKVWGPKASGAWPGSAAMTLQTGPLVNDVTTSGTAATLVATSNVEAINRANRLDQMAQPTSALNLNAQRMTNAAPGTASTDLPNMSQLGGWIPSADTWTFVANVGGVQFTISGVDRTGQLLKGTKIKWSESGTVKYGVVQSSSFSTDTTVNLIPTTDYVMTTTPDSNSAYYAYTHPAGFPTAFTWVPRVSIASCTTTLSSASISAAGAITGVSVGMFVYGTNIPTGTVPTVTAINTSTKTITLSSGTGVGAGTQTLIFGATGISALGTLLNCYWSVQNGLCTLGYTGLSALPDTQNSALAAISPPINFTKTTSTAANIATDNGTASIGTAVVSSNAITVNKSAGGSFAGTGNRAFAFCITGPI